MPSVLIGVYGATPAPLKWLPAMTYSYGQHFARLSGRPATRLTASLVHDATEAYVESTLNFRDAGHFYCAGERIAYTSRDATTFYGLVRDPQNVVYYGMGRPPHPIGTAVVDGNRRFSVSDQARDDAVFNRSEDRRSTDIAMDRGFGPLLSTMTAEDIRNYARANWYKRRQPWQTMFAVYRWLFHYYSMAGTTGYVRHTAQQTLVIPAAEVVNKFLPNRWIYVNGKLCRIIRVSEAAGKVTLSLEPTDGPFWQAPGLVPDQTDVAWEILAFTFETPRLGVLASDDEPPVQRDLNGSEVRVNVFAQNATAPTWFILDWHTDDPLPETMRPMAGILRSGIPVAHPEVGMFFPKPFEKAVKGAGSDLLAAGVKLTPFVIPVPPV